MAIVYCIFSIHSKGYTKNSSINQKMALIKQKNLLRQKVDFHPFLLLEIVNLVKLVVSHPNAFTLIDIIFVENKMTTTRTNYYKGLRNIFFYLTVYVCSILNIVIRYFYSTLFDRTFE